MEKYGPEYRYQKYKRKYTRLKNSMNSDIFKAVNELSRSHNLSFVTADIDISPAEKDTIAKLNIQFGENGNNFMNFFGRFNRKKLLTNITSYLGTIGNDLDTSKKVANLLVTKIIIPYLDANDNKSLWFTIRTEESGNNLFEIPRWHTDGYFYEATSDDEIQTKLVGILVGDATLFKYYNKDMLQKYRELQPTRNRELIDSALMEYPTFTPNNDQIVVFIVGNENRSAVHSEPNMRGKRFFYSVVGGNENQIRSLAERWKNPYIA